jgi:hypothetical protein
VADDFYRGASWDIGLRKFMELPGNKEMILYFRPMHADAEYLQDFEQDLIPDFGESSSYLKINEIKLTPIYQALITID